MLANLAKRVRAYLFGEERFKPRANVVLPAYGRVYVDHLAAEYQATVISGNPPLPADSLALSVIKDYKENQPLTWGRVYELERAILSMQPDSVLEERRWAIEKRFREAADEATVRAFEASLKKANPAKASREYLENLLRELYRSYTVTACREDLRNQLSINVGAITLAVLILMAALAYMDYRGSSKVTALTLAVFMGVVGGFISFQRRVQGISNRGESMTDLAELAAGSGIYLAPLTGAVFAVLLYVMFGAGMLEGALFPKIVSASGAVPSGLSFSTFSKAIGPATGADWCKLLVWSFLAGFAERLVPDTLDRITARAGAKAATPKEQ